MFESLSPDSTGVHFVNELPEHADINILNYLYYYNGGGVAVGDVNNDGLPDLYFTSNLGSNRLYLNMGNYRFEDITARAGVADSGGWKTGVTMADVNGDGFVDIYVSAVSHLTLKGRNVLFLNNGDGTFRDATKEFGLEHVGYSTQALFFDYDGDGDLDVFLLNHSTHEQRGVYSEVKRAEHATAGGNRLLRNDRGRFVDVTANAGITGDPEAFGLGVVASDFNGDGCPDLYVANDFQEDDFLYLNNCNGTFTESIRRAMPHTSRFSMGVDAADFNNDGRPDVVVADMLPERDAIVKSSASDEPPELFTQRLAAGYHPQFERNTLELNRGGTKFSDIAFLAGVAATDWSWAPLFADLDNDGLKDLFITSGIYRRPNDLDYIAYVSNPAIQASLAGRVTAEQLAFLKQMPQVPAPNHAFHNNGNFTFTNTASAWGLGEPGFSNGAVYADLNNSGALDLVVNRINAPAAIYRNHVREVSGNHYLRVDLRGSAPNTAGFGARVTVTHGSLTQALEQQPTRGFESSVDPRLHFGLGASSVVDTLTVVWPNRRMQVLTHVRADTAITLSQSEATQRYASAAEPKPLFQDITASTRIDFRHRENQFSDFARDPLVPRLVSAEGPALAVGDVNGDGLDDVYVGGAKWQQGRLFIQQADGTFRPSNQPAFVADSLAEDVDAVFFDANGDGHPDLYVVSGGNEFSGEDDALQDRLYLNDGKGTFRRDTTALPRLAESGSCVAAGDFNHDGHLDLFVGRRVVAHAYGIAPRSYLLENDGRGHFRDVTAEKAPALVRPGMITGAAWFDADGDGALDLVVVGDWMPVMFLRQESGRFVDRSAQAGLAGSNGWWSSVSVADLNGDSRPDLVLGNLGSNSYIRPTANEPARLYVYDFFQTGAQQSILTAYHDSVSRPVMSRDEMLRGLPQIHDRYPSYAAYAQARIEDLVPPSELRVARVLEARTLASMVALNRGNGTFKLDSLPAEAQFAPVNAALVEDFDRDGRPDLLLGGNFYGVRPILGRYDASYGLFLRGAGDGRFRPVEPSASGVWIDGQVRRMKVARGPDGQRFVVVARNDDRVLVLRSP